MLFGFQYHDGRNVETETLDAENKQHYRKLTPVIILKITVKVFNNVTLIISQVMLPPWRYKSIRLSVQWSVYVWRFLENQNYNTCNSNNTYTRENMDTRWKGFQRGQMYFFRHFVVFLSALFAFQEEVNASITHVLDGLHNGVYRPHINRTFYLDQIDEAHRLVDNEEVLGDVVLTKVHRDNYIHLTNCENRASGLPLYRPVTYINDDPLNCTPPTHKVIWEDF